MMPFPGLGYGDGSIIATAFTVALGSDNSGDNGFTYRQETPVALVPAGRRVRVTFQASSVAAFVTDHCSIGISAGSGATVGTPTELFFGGKPGFSLAAGGSITSDWVNFGQFGISDKLLVIMDINSGAGNGNARALVGSATGSTFYFKAATASYNSATVASLSTNANEADGVNLIEIQ